jgi:hypothetical protein
MRKSKGPTYSRLSCCASKSCSKFDSMLEVADCYNDDGRVVRNCSNCK